jgi:protein-S-isoprenylcysteine O-methyltransferase Ste14
MTNELFAITFINLLFIGLLPFLFFRRDGSFNIRWWLTGLPFFISAAGVTAARFEVVAQWQGLPDRLFVVPAVLLVLASMTMIGWTVGSHRVPLALWHQDNDAAAQIVNWGPYRYVRHPFYVAFLMTQAAAFLVAPHLITAIGFVYAIVVLSLTARREEARLLASTLGTEYRSYMTRTGRLLPGIGRLAT